MRIQWQGAKLSERVCFLSSAEEWGCMKELVRAMESTMSESREIILKCHPDFASLKPLGALLDEYVYDASRKANNLRARVSSCTRAAVTELRAIMARRRMCAAVY